MRRAPLQMSSLPTSFVFRLLALSVLTSHKTFVQTVGETYSPSRCSPSDECDYSTEKERYQVREKNRYEITEAVDELKWRAIENVKLIG